MTYFNRSRIRVGRPNRLPIALAVAGFLYVTAGGAAWAQNADGDVISLTAGLSLTRDSNILRIPDSQAVPAGYGTSKRSDMFLRGNLGIGFDRLISQQRLQANAEVIGYKYREYDDFDNIGYRAGVNYDWVIGRPLFGRIGARASREQPRIQDRLFAQPGASRNEIDTQTVYFDGGLRLTPSWSLIAGWAMDRWRNSSRFYEDQDSDHHSFEVGGRFAPGTGTEIDLVYRRTNGKYKNDQLFADDGGPILIAGRRGDFEQNALLARVAYKPSEDSRIAGRIGYTKRDFDQAAIQDFSGLTVGFDIEWAQTGALQWRVGLTRDIVIDNNALTSTYAEATGIRIAPIVQLTGRIQVLPYIGYTHFDYDGEASTAGPTRRDKYLDIGAAVNYEIRRNLMAVLELSREKRDSNIDGFDFSANIISIGLRARF